MTLFCRHLAGQFQNRSNPWKRFLTWPKLSGSTIADRAKEKTVERNLLRYLLLNTAASLGCLQGQTTLTVELHNYAEVPARILANAEKETARIFHEAGIQLSWATCAVSERDVARSPATLDACRKDSGWPNVRVEGDIR